MDKETIFKVLFKCKVDGDQKFTDFAQLTPAGRRVIILVINLALGGKPKDTLKWLKDRNIINESQYDERSVYDQFITENRLQMIKDQCGRHTLTEMAKL